jgi:hypothetical protein
MRFRKLRIAWSVGCGIVCVLLIVLWVRSYWRTDILPIRSNRAVMSAQAKILTVAINQTPTNSPQFFFSTKQVLPLNPFKHSFLGFGYEPMPIVPAVSVPYWAPILLAAVFGGAPWLRWRFSLRTLLIATTLVAVVLGLIVWLR